MEKLKMRLNSPIFVRLKNITEDKIYDLDIFSKGGNNKVERSISCVSTDGDMEFFDNLDSLLGDDILSIGCIWVYATMDYRKYVSKQLILFGFNLINSDDNTIGAISIDPRQMQDNIISENYKEGVITLKKGSSFVIDFLMPEMELHLRFYPMKIEISK